MSKFRFDRKAQRFRTQKAVLLEKMSNDAINHFKVDVFDSRSFDGTPWKPNKVQDGRQQLVKTARLRQGYRIMRRTANTRLIVNEVPYSVHHNNGTRHLPKRQLIGQTRKLRSMQRRDVNNYLRRGGKI